MTGLTKRFLTAFGAGAIASLSATSVAAATEWDYLTFFGVSHPVVQYQIGFAKEVEKRTNGELKITVRTLGELPFKASEALKVCGEGLVQMALGYAGFTAGTVPLSGVAGHPFLVRTYEEGAKVWPIIDKYTGAEFKKLGVKTMYHFYWPPQNMFGKGKPILTVADFAGRKIRTTDPKQSEMLNRLGASAVTLDPGEVPVAMDRGLMEGVLTASFNLVGAKWTDFIEWA